MAVVIIPQETPVVNGEKALLFTLKEKVSGLLTISPEDLILVEENNIKTYASESFVNNEVSILNARIDSTAANLIAKDSGDSFGTDTLKTMTTAEYTASPKTAGTLYFVTQP